VQTPSVEVRHEQAHKGRDSFNAGAGPLRTSSLDGAAVAQPHVQLQEPIHADVDVEQSAANEDGSPPVSEQLGGPALGVTELEMTDRGMGGCETHDQSDGQVRLSAHGSFAKSTPRGLD